MRGAGVDQSPKQRHSWRIVPSIVILDEDGNTVSVTEGPDHPTDTTTRDEIE